MTAARKPFTLIAAVLFLIVAAVHLYRLYSGFEVVIDAYVVPHAASWLGAAIAGPIGVMLLGEARK